MKERKRIKIIVAMSGGVDSSVAAAILKRENFDVKGIFMKLAGLPEFKESEKRAKKIAKVLRIPFLTLDIRKEFKKRVTDYFLKEYKKDFTPNPCVVCNKEIKFGLLLGKALDLGADFIATGHYARKQGIKNWEQEIEYKLLKGKDKAKDQSYFLWKLNQGQLKHILFPVGNYTKNQVIKLAKSFKLPALNIPESQEICFIPKNINNFLKRYLKPESGQIINNSGKILGQHQGLFFYTIGQRKGIKLPGGPYYVLDKNLKKNALLVTKKEKDLYKKEIIIKDVNWISNNDPKPPLRVNAKIRYRSELASAVIYKINNKYKIVFNRSQRAVTPGQSVVFYRGEELLGGGIIC